MSVLSLIGQRGLKSNDLPMSISSKLLIKDEEENQIITLKSSIFISLFFDGKNNLRCFEQSNCLDI